MCKSIVHAYEESPGTWPITANYYKWRCKSYVEPKVAVTAYEGVTAGSYLWYWGLSKDILGVLTTGIVCGRRYGEGSSVNLPGMWFYLHSNGCFSAKTSWKHNPNGQIIEHITVTWLKQELTANDTVFIGSFTGFDSKMASKSCVFQSESIAHGRSNAGAVLLLHSTTAGCMTKSETKLYNWEIYISHSITKTAFWLIKNGIPKVVLRSFRTKPANSSVLSTSFNCTYGYSKSDCSHLILRYQSSGTTLILFNRGYALWEEQVTFRIR